MIVLPVRTRILQKGDDIASFIQPHLQPNDIVVLSSKAIATTDGAMLPLIDVTATTEEKEWSVTTGLSVSFIRLILDETKRMHGTIRRAVPHALLTELKPDGMDGSLLVPNAGLDRSNVEDGYAIGWPKDPVASVKKLHDALHVPVILSDSCVHMGRRGVVAFALVTSGISPVVSRKGTPDLFGKPLIVTEEALADQLATAANAVMGNADEAIPAAIIRKYPHAPSAFSGWVPGIRAEEDIFPSFA